MGDYERQLRAQDFPGQVAAIRDRLERLPPISREALENHDAGIIERVQSLLDHALVLVATTTPQIIPTERPGELTTALTQVGNSLANLEEPSNASAYVPNVTIATSGLASCLWNWHSSVSGDDWRDAVKTAATTYRQSLGQQLASFNREIEGLTTAADSVRQDLAKLNDTAGQHRIDLDAQFELIDARSAEKLAALHTQVEAIQTQVTAALARQDGAISQYQDQFSTAQERRTTDFAAVIQDSKEAFAEARSKHDSDAQDQSNALRAEVEKAKDLVSVFAGAGTANGFGKEAKEQQAQANEWRKIAISLAVVGAIAGGVLIIAFGGSHATVAEVVGKLAVTVVIAGASGYAAAQSAAHRRREVNNRRSELLLVSFEPFVRELPTEERHKARVTLLQTLMSDANQIAGVVANDGAEPSLSANQLNLFKQMADILFRRQ